jgi:hypothetical protein
MSVFHTRILTKQKAVERKALGKLQGTTEIQRELTSKAIAKREIAQIIDLLTR